MGKHIAKSSSLTVTAAALFDTQQGPVIRIFHEYAHLGKGRSIYAAGQKD